MKFNIYTKDKYVQQGKGFFSSGEWGFSRSKVDHFSSKQEYLVQIEGDEAEKIALAKK